MQRPDTPRLHYAWVILAAVFACLLISAATRASPSILIVPLEQEFGWSRATISFAVSLNILLYGLVGPFAAGFINRYGPRRVIVWAAVVLGGGMLATRWVQQPWQLFVLWGLLVGIGTGMVAPVLGASVVQSWFFMHRGLAMGLLTASAATGQLLLLPVLARVVEAAGWRAAASSMAALVFLMAPIALLWVRNRPRDRNLEPLGLPAGM
ncbi:MAG: MFS transporter, partial [Sinobacteraceae bacterium]|nr:MFS transporter [Nevskiaceae bacterium]